MTPTQALNDACRVLCGNRATLTGRHDDACRTLRAALFGGGAA